MLEVDKWLKNCHFCHKPINYKEIFLKKQKTVGSFDKKTVYHEKCYEDLVLNFGTEEQRQDYFKMKEENPCQQ